MKMGDAHNAERPDTAQDRERQVVEGLQQVFTLLDPARQEIHELSRTMVAKSGEHGRDADASVLEAELQKAKQEIDRMHDNAMKTASHLKLFQTETETLICKHNAEMTEQKIAYQDIIHKQEKEITKHKHEIANLKSRSEEAVADLQQKLEKSEKEKKTERIRWEKEIAATKARLSKLMGDKLSNANPDIADLSDKNRPTKLAERCSELYDNQWTDAFEIAEKIFRNKSEGERLQILLDLLMDIHTFCKKEFERQNKDIKNILYRVEEPQFNPSEEIFKQIHQYWRASAEDCIPLVHENYLKHHESKEGEVFKLATLAKDFTSGCVALCWLMAHQDPPVVFDTNVKQGDKVNVNLYKAYTQNGKFVEYVVWPALLQHEGGLTLSKGIVQCMKLDAKENCKNKIDALINESDNKTVSDKMSRSMEEIKMPSHVDQQPTNLLSKCLGIMSLEKDPINKEYDVSKAAVNRPSSSTGSVDEALKEAFSGMSLQHQIDPAWNNFFPNLNQASGAHCQLTSTDQWADAHRAQQQFTYPASDVQYTDPTHYQQQHSGQAIGVQYKQQPTYRATMAYHQQQPTDQATGAHCQQQPTNQALASHVQKQPNEKDTAANYQQQPTNYVTATHYQHQPNNQGTETLYQPQPTNQASWIYHQQQPTDQATANHYHQQPNNLTTGMPFLRGNHSYATDSHYQNQLHIQAVRSKSNPNQPSEVEYQQQKLGQTSHYQQQYQTQSSVPISNVNTDMKQGLEQQTFTEEYPSHLVPSQREYAQFEAYINMYGYTQDLGYHMDTTFGQGSFARCQHFQMWLQGLQR